MATVTWYSMTQQQIVAESKDTDIMISFPGADVGAFWFTPDFAALIMPFRERWGDFQPSWEA